MATALHYLYPEVKTEVTEEESDHMCNTNINVENEVHYQVGEDEISKEKLQKDPLVREECLT